MKKLFTVVAIVISCQVQANAQGNKLVKYQYWPNRNAKFLSAKITDTTTSYFEGTKLYWFNLGGDTVIHVWKKDLDVNMRIGSVYTFKGLKKMVYKFK
ncbi:MAG: hypothetical protein EOO91_02225 [Pedobacter sp.]|nr:MAG: hypothetical protein EOO91_02225 [Pedobacter sp.]